MVFGWSQIIMDIQPLIVLMSGEGHLHGFSHTYVGASLLAIFSGVTGKYLSELGLKILRLDFSFPINISWAVSFASAFVGCFSHVLLDSVMHADIEPFFPITLQNDFLGIISVQALHKFCLYSGLLGVALFYGIGYWKPKT